jgi:Zn-dependent peptidase ImmA (M78 family)
MIHPVSRAISILKDLKISNLRNVAIEDIYAIKGILYEEAILVGSQARIVSTPNFSKITLSSTLTYKNQKRFAQAHELGHYEMHRAAKVICDNEKSFLEYHQKGGQEVEANEFASELLMPRKPFKDYVANKTFNLDLIREVADYFETSITSTSIKYADFGHENVAIVFSQDGRVKWVKINQNLPLQFIQVGLPVPVYSVVSDFYKSRSLPKGPVAIDAFVWFFNDYKIGEYSKCKIYEQVFPMESINSALSFIWFKTRH